MTSKEIQQLEAILHAAFDRPSWHGTNLRGSIRGVSPQQAAWRPGPQRPAAQRHNIWELVVHAAYWKYAAWRRLTGAERGSFPLEGSNWIRRPQEVTPRAWRADIALLERMHRQLMDAVAGTSAKDLEQTLPRSRVTRFALISGVAAHDLYHAGQIQLLKKLASS